MTLDFRAQQIRGNKFIASGSTGTNAKLLFYPFSSALNQSGSINPAVFATGAIGQDVFLFISGAIGSLGGTNSGVSVFGGDVHVSGTLRIQGSLLASGSGGSFVIDDTFWSHIDYWLANTASIVGGLQSGDFTVGTAFRVTKNRTILGVRFYAAFTGSHKLALWGPGGIAIMSQSYNVIATGVHSVNFSSSYNAIPYQLLVVSQYNSSSYSYVDLPAGLGQLNFTQAGPNHIFDANFGKFGTGDSYPNNTIGDGYLIEPVLATITQSVS